MLDVLTILFLFLTLIGVALFVLGWRGRRVDDHPWCRKCRFDLVGSWPASKTCPECGAALEIIGAVEVGQRRRRWIAFAVGLLMLIGCGFWLGRSALTSLGPIDWMHYKPDWWVARDAHSPDDDTADAALAELVRRIDSGALSDARTLNLVFTGLKLQANENVAWRTGWGDVIETAWKNGTLPPELILEYAQHAVNIQMVAESPKVRRWTFTRAGPQPTLLRAGSGDLTLQFSIVDQSFGGMGLRANPGEGATYTTLRANANALMAKTFAVLPQPGERELRITWRATLAPRLPPSMMKPKTTPTPATWDVPLSTTITVLPPASDAAELVTDEKMTEALRKSIEMRAVGLRVPPQVMGTPGGLVGGRIVLLVTFRDVPIAAQVQLVVSSTRNQRLFGGAQTALNLARGAAEQVRLFIYPRPEDEPDRISAQISAEPNNGAPGPMLGRRHTEQVWYGDPIMFDDIPVTWYEDVNDVNLPDEWRSIVTQPQGGGPLPGRFERGTIRQGTDGP